MPEAGPLGGHTRDLGSSGRRRGGTWSRSGKEKFPPTESGAQTTEPLRAEPPKPPATRHRTRELQLVHLRNCPLHHSDSSFIFV